MNTIKPISAAALNFSEEHKPLNPDLVEICRAMIKTSRQARGFTHEPKRNELDETAKAWASALKKHSIAEIKQMFDRAMIDYRDTSIPFGIPHLKTAARALMVERRQQVKTVIPQRCERHELVTKDRDEDDPPLIAGWRICAKCGAPFPSFNLSKTAPAPAPILMEVHRI